jgi:4'-phosphopantetheinyl transferase EntD
MHPDTGREAGGEDLAGLFPPGVACVCSRAAPAGAALLPEEAAAATAFAPVRLAEFRPGRDCARRALLRLGVNAVAIPVGPRREPLWPAGIVGSLSHAGPVAAAAVARREAFAAIGLDIETDAPLDPALIGIICRPEEIHGLPAAGAGARAKLLFSAKESVYKALWPLVQRFIDFQEVEVRLDARGDSFSVHAHGDSGLAQPVAAVRGRVAWRDGLVATGAWIEATGLAGRSATP